MKILDKNLEILKKINLLKIEGIPIYDFCRYKHYSTWSFNQIWLWDALVNRSVKKQEKNIINILKRIKNIIQYSILALLLILKLRINKTKILVYSIAKSKKDFRLAKVFNFLEKNNIKYREVVHGLKANLYNAKPVFFIDLVNLLFSSKKVSYQLELDEFEEDQRDYLREVINGLLANTVQSEKKIKFIRWYLKLTGINTLLTIDDPRYYNELIIAAQELGIKVVSFQHGRFNKYLTGWINYNIPPEKCVAPDKFIVWNKYWRDELISLSSVYNFYKKRVVIGGQPFYSNNDFMATQFDGQLVVLIPFELKADKEAVRNCIKQLLLIPKLKIYFKARPDQDIEEQLKISELHDFKSRPNFNIIQELNAEILKEINLVIGTYSTLLYEMIESGKPVMVLRSDNTQADNLVDGGLADFLTDNSVDLESQMKSVASTSIDILKERKNTITTQVDMNETLKKILKSPKVIGVIPARLHSTRLSKKMLADVGGKPLIYHTWKNAQKADVLDEVIVATDSQEIFDIISKEGGRAVMTSSNCLSGTDRIAEAINNLTDIDPEIIVNIQGDEPLMPTEVIIEIVRKIKEDNNSQIVTAVTPFGDSIDAADQGNVKAVIDNKGRALYFTRSQVNGAFHHLGIYAYRKDFLFEFVKLPQSNLEKLEKLEQLRALENGYQIGVVIGDWQSIGIDTERDLEQFKILKLSENVHN